MKAELAWQNEPELRDGGKLCVTRKKRKLSQKAGKRGRARPLPVIKRSSKANPKGPPSETSNAVKRKAVSKVRAKRRHLRMSLHGKEGPWEEIVLISGVGGREGKEREEGLASQSRGEGPGTISAVQVSNQSLNTRGIPLQSQATGAKRSLFVLRGGDQVGEQMNRKKRTL